MYLKEISINIKSCTKNTVKGLQKINERENKMNKEDYLLLWFGSFLIKIL